MDDSTHNEVDPSRDEGEPSHGEAGTDRSEDGTDRRRTVLRRAGIAALALAALVAVGYLALGLLLHTMADPDRLARWTERRLEASLDRDVEVGSVRLGVFPRLEVEVREVRVDNPPDFEAPPFAEVERIRLGVALLPLLRRRVVIDQASVAGATGRLRVLEDGRSNFGDFVPAEGETPASDGPAALRTEVGRVGIERITVSYRNDATGLRAEATGVSGRAALGEASAEGRPVEVALAAAGLSASGLPGGRSLEPRTGALQLRGETGDGFRRLQIREGRVELGSVRVGLEGRVDSLRSPVRRVQLRLTGEELALEDLLALAEALGPSPEAGGRRESGGAAPTAWDSLRATGTVGLDVEIRGALGSDRKPGVEGRATFRDGAYGVPGRAALAEALAGEVRIGADTLWLEGIRGRLLGGTLEASGAVAVDSPRAFRLTATADPRLEAWDRARPGAASPGQMSGAVELDLTLRGRAGQVDRTRVTGTARPADVRIRRPGWSGDLAFPAGSLRLDGDGLSAGELPVVAAGDTLRADLEVTRLFSSRAGRGGVPSLTAALRGPRLRLDALLGREAADTVTYGRLVFARLGGRRVAGRTPEELAAREGFRRPDSLPVEGTVRADLDRVDWGPYRMDDVELEARLAPDRLEITRARLSTFGGRSEGTLSLELGAGPLAPFSLDLGFQGVEAGPLLSTLTPLGALTTGTASFSLAGSGHLDTLLLPVADTLSGDGSLETTDGQLRENPVTAALARALSRPALQSLRFQRWTLPFEVRGDTLMLPRSRLTGTAVPVDFAGRMGFGGDMRLAATVQLPREAAASLAGRGGGLPASLLRRVAGGDGTLPVGLGLTGTVTDPKVEVELDALRRAVEGAGREEAAGEVERRAGGLLRRILGEQGDTTRADTVGGRPDTAGTQPDTAGARADTAGTSG